MLTKAIRMILVQYVLTSMLIYILMALELLPCALKAIDKIRREFLWKGRKDARGESLLISLDKSHKSNIFGRPRHLRSPKHGMGTKAQVAVVAENRT